MNWEKEYRQKTMSADEAVAEFVQSGDVIYGSGATVACTALNAVFRAIDKGTLSKLRLHIHTYTNPGLELDQYDFSRDQLDVSSHFWGPGERALAAAGKCSYVPVQFGMHESYMAFFHPTVSILMMSPPDSEGYCNIGPFGYIPAALEQSERVIAQISRHVPRVNGTCHRIHVSRINAFIMADEEMALLINRPASPVEEAIAQNLLNYIPDGACIQLGIGSIANAVGFGLRDKHHLGIHTEVFTESMVDLMECGAVDNSRKTTYPGKSVVGFMHGTKRQYDFVDGNMDMLFCRFSELVNIPNIAANDNMISINGAVSVDLTGQVSAESIGPRQYSGTGGQLDFVRGAALSKGGASFIAIPSTARTRSGVVSRIVPQLAPGSIVTTPRTDVQYVATEYGVARLQFCDVPERVRRLISISHPDYRDELIYAARQSGLLY